MQELESSSLTEQEFEGEAPAYLDQKIKEIK